MKTIGRLVVMSAAEYCATLVRTVVDDDKMYTAGVNAGKFHSAGGYSHTLPRLKEELRQAREQVARYKPIAEIFQPSEALIALLQDVNGVSDCDAAADFETVKHQARRARSEA